MKKQNAFPKDNEYDPKENFLKITNDFQDALCKIRIAGEDRQILDAIIRMTFGYKKNWEKISNRKFREMTGMEKRNIIRSRKRLLNMQIIKVVKFDTTNNLYYRIEKDSTQWRMLSKMTPLKKSAHQVSKMTPSPVVENDNLNGVKNDNHLQADIKDTLKDISLKTEEDDIILTMSKTELKTRKDELIEDRKELLASHQNVQYYDDAINKISQRLKQLSQPSNPSSHKISRSERKKIISKKETRS